VHLPADKSGEDPIGVDDPAVPVAVHDDVAERVDEALETLFALLHLPHLVGECFQPGSRLSGLPVQLLPGAAFLRQDQLMQQNAHKAGGKHADAEEGGRAGEVGKPGEQENEQPACDRQVAGDGRGGQIGSERFRRQRRGNDTKAVAARFVRLVPSCPVVVHLRRHAQNNDRQSLGKASANPRNFTDCAGFDQSSRDLTS
jgi:hypothetical protein